MPQVLDQTEGLVVNGQDHAEKQQEHYGEEPEAIEGPKLKG